MTKSFDVTVTLVDPCINAVITTPNQASLIYTITDTDKSISLEPKASVVPNICQLDSETTTPTNSGIQDNVVYNKDDETIRITQITNTLAPSNPNNDGSTKSDVDITTSYTTTDYYGNTNTPTVVIHVVTIKNPCVDPSFVSISAPNNFDP